MTLEVDRQAAEERFRTVFVHLGAVTGYARRRGSKDADALAADVMTIAWRRLADVPADDPLPWLYGTARNLVLAEARLSARAAGSSIHAPEPGRCGTRAGQLDPELGSGDALAFPTPTGRRLLLVAWEDLTPSQAAQSARHQPRPPSGPPLAGPTPGCAPSLNRPATPAALSQLDVEGNEEDSTLFAPAQREPRPAVPTPVDGAGSVRPPSRRARRIRDPRSRTTAPAAWARARILISWSWPCSPQPPMRFPTGSSADAVKPKVTEAGIPSSTDNSCQLPPGSSWPALNIDPNSVTSKRAGGGSCGPHPRRLPGSATGSKRFGPETWPLRRRAHNRLSTLLAENMLVAPIGAPEDWTPPKPPDAPYAVFAHDGGFEWVRRTYTLAAAGHRGGSSRVAVRTRRADLARKLATRRSRT